MNTRDSLLLINLIGWCYLFISTYTFHTFTCCYWITLILVGLSVGPISVGVASQLLFIVGIVDIWSFWCCCWAQLSLVNIICVYLFPIRALVTVHIPVVICCQSSDRFKLTFVFNVWSLILYSSMWLLHHGFLDVGLLFAYSRRFHCFSTLFIAESLLLLKQSANTQHCGYQEFQSFRRGFHLDMLVALHIASSVEIISWCW